MKIFNYKLFMFLPDRQYLKLKYFLIFKKRLNLDTPKTFNEKINWLKLYDRRNEYSQMVDKIEAKKYVSKFIGDEYIIPTIGVYDSFEDIEFNDLPNQFVIKCTHDSGGLIICKDKKNLNIKSAKKIINKCLKRKYFYQHREWPYKNIKPRIIVEKYMEDNKTKELRDYKFFCFNGKVELMFIATDRGIHQTKFNFYDRNFNLLDIKQHYPNDSRKISKPINFEKMIELAEKLSKGIPHLRVDFYEINGKIYFGELTFSHFAGLTPFQPEKWDLILGEKIDLNIIKNN